MHQLIAVTGMGIISPAGNGIAPLWKSCLAKTPLMENGIARVNADIIAEASQSLASSSWIRSTPEGKSMIMSAKAVTDAISAAQWNKFFPDDVMIIGTTTGQIGLWEGAFSRYASGIELNDKDIAALAKQPLSTLSRDLAEVLGFPGRILILTSACSASTQALILGQEMLKSGRAGRVIAGGVEELGNLTLSGFGCLKLLNTSACKPFDQDRIGINLSEGSAFYTLENNPSGKVLGYLAGGDSVLDSYHMTSPNPEGMGLQKAMLSALERAGINANEISFVHSHGTGSTHNDSSESFAIAATFPHSPEVVSTKGIHGHALGASGAIEFGICLQMVIFELPNPTFSNGM